jgi:hypothetical protein
MSRLSKFSTFLVVLALLTATSLAVAFPFWLSAPSRSNPNDPMSPDHVKTPQGTPTDTFTQTFTPTPTFTPTFGPGPLLADFENTANGPDAADDNWDEPIIVGADTDGTTMSPAVWGQGTETAGNGPSLPGDSSGCISGTMIPQNGGNFPFAFIAMDMTPTGNTGGAGTNIGSPIGSNNGVQFDYKGTVGVQFAVQMMAPLSDPACGNYYQWTVTPPNDDWNSMDIYFPGVNTFAPIFAQPNYGCTPATTTWNAADMGAVQFKVLASTTASENYNLCVDNVTFNPPPAPTPFVISPVVFNGEQSVTTTADMWNQAINIANSVSSTVYPASFLGTPSSVVGADPNFPASTYYARITGTVADQTGTGADPYPYAYMSFDLALGGTNGTNFATCVPYATNNGFQFDYKAGAACVQYVVELISANITGTAYWQYTWTSQDTNWHTVDVYFPAGGSWTPPAGVNVLSQPSYGTGAFDPTQVGAFLFKPVAPVNSPAEAYDLSITNLTFAAPVATGGPPLDVSGSPGNQVNTAGTIISTFENAPLANNACDGGQGPIGSGPIDWGFGGGATTVDNAPWAANSPTSGAGTGENGPTLAGSNCMEFVGTLDTSGNGAYAIAQFGFVPGGPDGVYGTATEGVPGYVAGQAPGPAYSGNIETLAPHKRLVFDYKNGTAAVEGQEMEVQFCMQNDPNYDFYFYTWDTAMDTNWHTIIVYFPDSPYGPQFTAFPGECTPWDPTQAEMIEIGPVNPGGGESFNLWLDNLWFD